MRRLLPGFRATARRGARTCFALGLALGLTHCTDAPPPTATSGGIAAPADPEPILIPLPEAGCEDGKLPTPEQAAKWRICLPPLWNGDMLVYTPGFFSPYEEPRIRDDDLRGTSVQQLATNLGFVFATTSYHKGGLVLPQAIDDLVSIVALAHGRTPTPSRHVYLVGPSLGGLVTARAIELRPDVFHGGLAACGPYGSFRGQTDYVGDFRVLFDHLLGNGVPGWQTWRQTAGGAGVPEDFVSAWEPTLRNEVELALARNPGRAVELLRTSRAPIDPGDVHGSTVQTVRGVLWYHLFGTNDALDVLGGNPFQNRGRWYFGSSNDLRLNLLVPRFTATGSALTNIAAHYETTGRIGRPVVTLHTSRDEIVPRWHQLLYSLRASPWYRHVPIAVDRYGHCNFTPEEVLAAFAVLFLRVSTQNLWVSSSAVGDVTTQEKVTHVAREHGARPRFEREVGHGSARVEHRTGS